MQAAALAGTDFAIAAPPGYQIAEELVEEARATAKKSGSQVLQTVDPEEAVRDADALYADVWLSMGDAEDTKAARQAALGPYQVNSALLEKAKSDAIFMHCLPAHRGEEVTAEVADGSRSVIFDQAENRLHTAVAILYALLESKLEGNRRG
jgi:ornithine carbamoyltransferase